MHVTNDPNNLIIILFYILLDFFNLILFKKIVFIYLIQYQW